MRAGVRLGVDVGSVRVGVARSDPDGLLATPLVTLRRGKNDLGDLVRLAQECDAVEVVVGLPRTLAARHGAAAAAATLYAQRLVARLAPSVTVRMVDERLSTVAATRDLRASGIDARKGRKVIDQAAAVIILQGALDAERTAGVAPGVVLEASKHSSKVEMHHPKAEGHNPKAEGHNPKAEGHSPQAGSDSDVGVRGTGTDMRTDE